MSKWISIQGDLYNIDCFQKIEMLRPDTDREDRWALRAFYIIREDGVYRGRRLRGYYVL